MSLEHHGNGHLKRCPHLFGNSICAAAFLACLLGSATTLVAAETVKTIRLDGTTLYIPEVKINRKVNPVTTFLHIGSWKDEAESPQSPLCKIDSKDNTIQIKSFGQLLNNSMAKVLTLENTEAFLKNINWNQRQETHIAFRIVSDRRQPAMIEVTTDSGAALFHNGRFVSYASAEITRAAEGRGRLPVMLNRGNNIINIRLSSAFEKPRFELAVSLDQSRELEVAWRERDGLLKKLICPSEDSSDVPALAWKPALGNFHLSLEVHDLSTGGIIFEKEPARQGRVFDDEDPYPAPGIYEATYRTASENTSELFMIGNPNDLFAELQEALSKHNPAPEVKLDIEAQVRRARILLADDNYHFFDRQWQEKTIHTLSSLAVIERKLREGAVNISKDQPGLHIRSFASGADGSIQYYRLFVPSTYKSSSPLPLVVIPSARIVNRDRPFVEGPVMANHREALRWAKSAEKHGFVLLWPGYRGVPEGYPYESAHVDEAIRAVERDYNIDKHRIGIYAVCGAGFNAGRLVSEYNNRFAAIVYERAVFDLSVDNIKTPSLLEWYAAVNPSRHVIGNRNLRIFVLHDNTAAPGHGPMEWSTKFLAEARKTRDDIISHLSDLPMTSTERMDKMFSWLSGCRNESPDGNRSRFLEKAGYTGPIMEIFTTPLLVVQGTHAQSGELENIKSIADSLQKNYAKHFHGAKCAVKKDTTITQDDIDNHSLILIGNAESNSVWEKLQPLLPVKVSASEVLYKNERLAGAQPFQAIVRHPAANGKYVLMIGAADLKYLAREGTSNLFDAWYDCRVSTPRRIISKLNPL